jgi:Integrase core domain
MQVELLDRKRWRTRTELANAILEYLEIFHNRRRRHSALGMLTPVEFDAREYVLCSCKAEMSTALAGLALLETHFTEVGDLHRRYEPTVRAPSQRRSLQIKRRAGVRRDVLT